MTLRPAALQQLATHWERDPVLLPAAFDRPLADTADVLRALHAAEAARCRLPRGRENPFGAIRFFADTSPLAPEFFPYAAETSVREYVHRVATQLAPRRFGCVLDRPESYDRAIWLRLRELLRGIAHHVGLAPGVAQMSFFLGNYDGTPFGVHTDEASVIAICLEGRRKVHLWHTDAWTPDRDHQAFRQYLDDAETIELGPGDVLYWPSNRPHIVESLGYSVALSVGMNVREPSPIRATSELVAQWLTARDDGRWQCSRYEVGALPAPWTEMIAALGGAIESPAFRELALRRWLTHESTLGIRLPLAHLPQPDAVLGDGDVGAVDPQFPVYCVELGNGGALFGGNGWFERVADTRHARALCDRLNTGAAIRAGDVIERALLDGLYRAGVFLIAP